MRSIFVVGLNCNLRIRRLLLIIWTLNGLKYFTVYQMFSIYYNYIIIGFIFIIIIIKLKFNRLTLHVNLNNIIILSS